MGKYPAPNGNNVNITLSIANPKNIPAPPKNIIHQAATFVFIGSETFSIDLVILF